MLPLIRIPAWFDVLLSKDSSLEAGVKRTFSIFESWLRMSRLPFFPDYTDHGPQHIAEVLSTVEKLIGEPSRQLLTPVDIAVLCVAVLLHDLGMHIDTDGFSKPYNRKSGSSRAWSG